MRLLTSINPPLSNIIPSTNSQAHCETCLCGNIQLRPNGECLVLLVYNFPFPDALFFVVFVFRRKKPSVVHPARCSLFFVLCSLFFCSLVLFCPRLLILLFRPKSGRLAVPGHRPKDQKTRKLITNQDKKRQSRTNSSLASSRPIRTVYLATEK